MLFEPMTLTLIAIAVIFAGISKGGFGSGAAFAATPIIAVAVDPRTALGIMLPLLMLMDGAALKSYWRQWNVPSSRAMILGGLPGVALAAAVFQITNADVFRLLIGAIAIGFVAFEMARARGWINPKQRPFSRPLAIFTGTVAGFTSFISHAGGPPVAMFMLTHRSPKTEYQATTVIVFTAINIMKFFPYAFLGIFTLDTLAVNLWMAPVAFLGVWIGVKAHHLVPEKLFFQITYVLLTCTGAKLIRDALT